MREKIKKELYNSLGTLIPFFILLFFFIRKYGINSVVGEISGMIDNIGTTNDVQIISSQTGDFINTGNIIDHTGDENNNIDSLDIDIVYKALEEGKAGYDYSVITFKPQIKKGSEGSYIDSELLKSEYLPNNRYILTIPENITGGYLYIKTNKELKYISNIGVYQPITIWTNIFFNGRRTYGRLNTKESLPVYEANQEFLYKLSYVPIKDSKGTNWLIKEGDKLEIGGFVGDVSGNGIDKIIFIWQR